MLTSCHMQENSIQQQQVAIETPTDHTTYSYQHGKWWEGELSPVDLEMSSLMDREKNNPLIPQMFNSPIIKQIMYHLLMFLEVMEYIGFWTISHDVERNGHCEKESRSLCLSSEERQTLWFLSTDNEAKPFLVRAKDLDGEKWL